MCEGRTCASSPSQMNAAFSKDYFKNHSFNLNFWVLVPFFLLIFQSILRYGMPIWFWKMVSSWEKTTFRFSNTVFSWKKWPSNFQKWFCHEKKPLFNFQTRFFHGKNGRPNFKNGFVTRKKGFSNFNGVFSWGKRLFDFWNRLSSFRFSVTMEQNEKISAQKLPQIITQDLHMSSSYEMVFTFFMFGPRLAKKHIQHGFVSRCGKSYDMLKLSYRFAFWNSGTCRMCRGNVVELPFVLQSESYI